jgi:hypothetical protein
MPASLRDTFQRHIPKEKHYRKLATKKHYRKHATNKTTTGRTGTEPGLSFSRIELFNTQDRKPAALFP